MEGMGEERRGERGGFQLGNFSIYTPDL